MERFESLSRIARRSAGPISRFSEIALTACLGLVAARLIWLAVEPGGAVSPDLPVHSAAPVQQGAGTPMLVDTSRLVHENPFGAAITIVADLPDAPETSLNLRLRGVRASSEETGGIAWITTPDNQTAAYAPDDVILDGVTLHRIYADRVTLRKGGQTEALIMEGGAGLLSVLTSPDNAPAARTTGNTRTATGRVARADLMANVTIDPVHRGQDFIGYRLGTRGDTAVLQSAGLMPGDIVTGLDGAAITDVPPAELARKFSDPAAVRLVIDRNGQTLEHTLAPEEARPQ